MPAHIAPPCVALPGNTVTTDEICADIRRAHPDLPRLEAFLRIARASTVETRHFCRPLGAPTVAGNALVEQRNRAAYEDASVMAVEAARRALDAARLRPEDIDCVITSHTTSWTVPSLDLHLIAALGLRPEIRRHPMSTTGCAGGAQGCSAPATTSPPTPAPTSWSSPRNACPRRRTTTRTPAANPWSTRSCSGTAPPPRSSPRAPPGAGRASSSRTPSSTRCPTAPTATGGG